MARNNFSFLFVALLILLAVEPFLGGAPRSGALIQLSFTSLLVVGVFSLAATGRAFHLGIGLGVVGLATAAGFLWTGAMVLRVVNLVAIACFCLLAIGVALRHVVALPGAVTLNRVVGALCIYLLLGVLWAMLFAFVDLVEPGAFHDAGRGAGEASRHLLYYSFVTLTTLGYGDIAPVHPVARTLAYLEAVIGQLYIAVLIASLVARHIAGVESGSRPAAG
jgi:hypothetical protein